MQQVARNQVQYKIWQLEERIEQLKAILPQVDTVQDYGTYQIVAGDVIDNGDAADLTALKILSEYYYSMKTGNYF